MFGFLRAINNPSVTYDLDSVAISIGRDKSNALVLPSNNKSMSNRHAVLEFIPLSSDSSPSKRQYFAVIRDLYSTNGTYVNGVKMSPSSAIMLQNGDLIRFGLDSRQYMCHFSASVQSASELANQSTLMGEYLSSRFRNTSGYDSDDRETTDMSNILDQTAVFSSPKSKTRTTEILEDLEHRVDHLEDQSLLHHTSNIPNNSQLSPSQTDPRLSIVQKALLSDITFVATSVRNKIVRLNGHDSSSSSLDMSATDFDKSIDRGMPLSDVLQSVRDGLYKASKELDLSLAEDSRKSRIIDSSIVQERKNEQLESYNKQLEKKLSNFRMQVWELENKLVSLQRDHETVKREKITAEGTIDRLVLDKSKLVSQLRDMETQMEDKTTENDSVLKELSFYRDHSSHLEKKNANLSMDNTKLKSFLSDKKLEVAKLHRSIDNITDEH